MEHAARGREGFPWGATSSLLARPHLTLATGAAVVLVLEWFRGSETLDTSAVWPIAQAVVAATALALVWPARDSLRLRWVLLLGLAFHLGWVALHLELGVTGDHDPVNVYRLQGQTLLDGDYPDSEYPPGAVALFALETWLGGGSARTANALLMIPFQLACVALVWSLRTRFTPWLAAAVALWPMNAFFWEFRFDLVPTAALLAGLVLAHRGRWYEAGFALGLGATVKWTPALALLPLLLRLLWTRRFRAGGVHLLGFLIPVAVVNLPLLAWRADELVHAYTTQNARTVTAESFVYLPISLFWDVGPGYWYFGAADVPPDANRAAIWMQLVVVAAVVLLAVVARTQAAAVALAGLAPAVFLLMNRIFSPQFYVLVLAAVVVAAALVVSRREELFAVLGACAVATTANTVLFQSLLGAQPVSTVPSWMAISALSFVPTVAAVAWLAVRAALQGVDAHAYVDTFRGYRAGPVTPPPWIARAVRSLAIGAVALFAIAAAFVAIVMPYRFWDSLAFGAWSRTIAATGSLWDGTIALNAGRPLFYVPQGLLWRHVTEDEWIGRLLSLSFAALLIGSIWLLARQLSPERSARVFLPPLAASVMVCSAVLASAASSGLTDVPVAAAAAATATVLWSRLNSPLLVPLAAVAAAATILAKPSGLLALAGVALATVVLRGRNASLGLVGVALGVAAALAYDAWQAARLDVSLLDVLRAGNDDFWLARGAEARWEALASAGWIGAGARLLVLYGLAYGVARALGAEARAALGAGAGVALVWSVVGPLAGDGEVGYPFDGSAPGIAAWILMACAMVAAPFLADHDPVPRRAYVALLVWLAPIAVVWASQRPDEARLLSPAWPVLALLSAAALTSASLALLRRRAWLALAPMTAVAAMAVTNLVAIDGLGRDGWRTLLDLGPSGWRDPAEMENFAYGPFSYHLNLARENVRPGDRVVSSDGRLQYFFPGQVEVYYARTCGELEGARFFSFLTSGESLELAELSQQPTDPMGWIQCKSPRVTLVGEQAGIYAAFVVGDPARPPSATDCRVAASPGQLLDAVFGSDLAYEEASALATRALGAGFEGTHIERTNCSSFRVVVTGVPEDATVKRAFREQVRGVGLDVSYEPGARFPEVPAGIPPVPP